MWPFLFMMSNLLYIPCLVCMLFMTLVRLQLVVSFASVARARQLFGAMALCFACLVVLFLGSVVHPSGRSVLVLLSSVALAAFILLFLTFQCQAVAGLVSAARSADL